MNNLEKRIQTIQVIVKEFEQLRQTLKRALKKSQDTVGKDRKDGNKN